MRSCALIALLFALPAFAADEPSRCEKIRAEFREMERLSPRACEESRGVHARYQKGFLEVSDLCRRFEARASGGPPKLKLGTAEEMGLEATEIRQKDMQDRLEVTNHLAHELLWTPIDTDSPARPPAQVADACRDELDAYAKIRRVVLTAFGRFFTTIDQQGDALFVQAQERALPRGTRPASVK